MLALPGNGNCLTADMKLSTLGPTLQKPASVATQTRNGESTAKPSAQDFVVIGTTTILDRGSNRDVEAVILRAETGRFHQTPTLEYHVKVDGRRVGFMHINRAQLDAPTEFKRVFIEYMNATEGNKAYRGVGTRLHQVAFEESLNRLGYVRTLFISEPGAVVFHFRSGYHLPGYRTLEEHEARVVFSREEPDDPFGRPAVNFRMVPQPDALVRWSAQIERAPILHATRQRLNLG